MMKRPSRTVVPRRLELTDARPLLLVLVLLVTTVEAVHERGPSKCISFEAQNMRFAISGAFIGLLGQDRPASPRIHGRFPKLVQSEFLRLKLFLATEATISNALIE